jgi:hypothetical protein
MAGDKRKIKTEVRSDAVRGECGLTVLKVASPTLVTSDGKDKGGGAPVAHVMPLQKKQKLEQEMQSEVHIPMFHR